MKHTYTTVLIATFALALSFAPTCGMTGQKTDATTGATGKSGTYAKEEAPPSARKLYERARAYIKTGNYQAALARLDAAVKTDPGFAEAHYLRGRALVKLTRLQDALEALTTAIQINPVDIKLLCGALYTRATIRHDMGEYGAAVHDLTRAMELLPGYAIMHFKRAEAYMGMGELQKAIHDLTLASELDPAYQAKAEEMIKILTNTPTTP